MWWKETRHTEVLELTPQGKAEKQKAECAQTERQSAVATTPHTGHSRGPNQGGVNWPPHAILPFRFIRVLDNTSQLLRAGEQPFFICVCISNLNYLVDDTLLCGKIIRNVFTYIYLKQCSSKYRGPLNDYRVGVTIVWRLNLWNSNSSTVWSSRVDVNRCITHPLPYSTKEWWDVCVLWLWKDRFWRYFYILKLIIYEVTNIKLKR